MTENENEDGGFMIFASPLFTKINDESTYVDIEIYRGKNDDFWMLEVADETGGSIAG